MVKEQDSWDGKSLREMFRVATRLLRENASAIDALNVFPVPDGDTGTNLLFTMQAAIEEASFCPDNNVSAVAQAMAHGSLMGARGNSGVILSQIFRGLAQEFEGRENFSGEDMANALAKASTLAYKGVNQPVEGTMLTVIREVSTAVQAATSSGPNDLVSIMEVAVTKAKESVAKTPDLLPVLKESGVVDAGGQGLYVILEGVLRSLKGERIVEEAAPLKMKPAAFTPPIKEPKYGYCTEFIICGNALDLEKIRERLNEIGDSVMVVGDETTARVHLHTFDPGAALSYGVSLGALRQIKIDNIEEQYQKFIVARKALPQPLSRISLLAVVSGEGLSQVFQSLGVDLVVPGGESMNPSVQELWQAVESAPREEVIILPNNPDVLPAASQVQKLSQKKVVVVPSKTIPQGIAAVLAFNPEFDLETNERAMLKGMLGIRSGEITTAVRSMRYKSLKVRKGQAIGFVERELVVAAESKEEALQGLLRQMEAENKELLTIYYGAGVNRVEVERLLEPVRLQYPHLEIEVVFGGQPHYDYFISVE